MKAEGAGNTEPTERLSIYWNLVEGEIDILQVEKRIRVALSSKWKSQREYYLNEQMKGSKGTRRSGAPNEIEELAQRIEKAGMPKDAKAKVQAELNKLKMMSPMSARSHGGAQLY